VSTTFEFDAAISFLSGDLAIAQDIHDRLAPALKVFVYARSQEIVALMDGLESFRTVFKDRARLSIVLFRRGWGETPWTGVEEIAIRERCLQTKYRSLMLINLDASETPSWIPDTYLHFDLKRYPPEQLAGAIKARAEESGAKIRKVSNADRAEAMERRRAFDSETEGLLGNGPGEWDAACNELMDAVRDEAVNVHKRTGWNIECGPGALVGGFVVISQGQTVQLVGRERYANSARKAYLELLEYDTGLAVQQPGYAYHAFEPLKVVGKTRIEIRRLPGRGWCWESNGTVHPPQEMAATIIGVLLGRIESAAARMR
jgi:hypothetical protein